MKKRKSSEQDLDAYMLGGKIKGIYKKFGVNISIVTWSFENNRIRFEVELKGSTTEAGVCARATDVQTRLKLPLFRVFEEGFTTYIVVSEQEIENPRLLKVLDNFAEKLEKMELPYVVGYDARGRLIVVDLSEFPHLQFGGSTNSGKSVGLQALITTIIENKSPSEANLILISVGAGDLLAFDGVPHLSCPVVQECDSAYQTITALKFEMERRIKLEHADQAEFEKLPRLVLVIDEFPALFTELSNKDMSKSMASNISSLLQRGRHAKIHVVLAAQDPTYRNMKVDLGNITARIAFKCAKKNNSETILGEGGAEKLRKPGELLLKAPRAASPQWLQGIYVRPKDIKKVVQDLESPRYVYDEAQKFHLIIPTESLTEKAGNLCYGLGKVTVASGPSEQDLLLAAVIFWALGLDHISTNMLMNQHHLGWNKANSLVKRLEELGVVDELDGKKPRRVRPKSIDDLSDELLAFMSLCNYSHESVAVILQERAEGEQHGSL